ncbi:biotin carboxylase N-terminal domain-containing protein [Lapidilactobacillus mulanensis]|uniref:biotin carboxylase n=1 Tax=Lapidilactobacillus mulanensis TaxID=2485999 RepID=A0ABW4DKH4_9LACO|nr:biotin carboxylase N-terminal domain-containing protein [Lapidilactobacillus mulanensis]
MIKKVLIANRGEIAQRMAEVLDDHGILSVSVYANDDFNPILNKLSTEYVCLGSENTSNTYLDRYKLIDIAIAHNCDAIYPGYGFLSEDANFVKLCNEFGLIFIGPNYEALELVGNKQKTITLANNIKVPTIPGSSNLVKSFNDLEYSAKIIGFPIILKSSNGGGGKGIRIVRKEEDLARAWDESINEGKLSFGSIDGMYLEKYLEKVKHIEVQILRDKFGNVMCFPERDCSLQYNQQKMIEESPCPFIKATLREKLQEYSEKIVNELNYENAGTIEFLVDEDQVYFMEMNGRIQLEYSISEFVTGVDILYQQIQIANFKKIRNIKLNPEGHALECRLQSIDSETFTPSIGVIKYLYLPTNGLNNRIDTDLFLNKKNSIYYDSLQAKVVCVAKNRILMLNRMLRMINQIEICGVETNITFLKKVLISEKMKNANYTINTLEEIRED